MLEDQSKTNPDFIPICPCHKYWLTQICCWTQNFGWKAKFWFGSFWIHGFRTLGIKRRVLFCSIFIYDKGVWGTQISWLFLIHHAVSESQKMGFRNFGWYRRSRHNQTPRLKQHREPPRLGLTLMVDSYPTDVSIFFPHSTAPERNRMLASPGFSAAIWRHQVSGGLGYFSWCLDTSWMKNCPM